MYQNHNNIFDAILSNYDRFQFRLMFWTMVLMSSPTLRKCYPFCFPEVKSAEKRCGFLREGYFATAKERRQRIVELKAQGLNSCEIPGFLDAVKGGVRRLLKTQVAASAKAGTNDTVGGRR